MFLQSRLVSVYSRSHRSCFVYRNVSYSQGQSPEPKIREYFYYIDHEGMLFLDDAKLKNFTSCFKEKEFLRFFFSHLKFNNITRYCNEFPYLSLCGRERNFVRCDDAPIVYTNIVLNNNGDVKLTYNHMDEQLSMNFQPQKLFMNPDTGRLYHPAWPQVGNIGLIRSKLAVELSKYFEFNEGDLQAPTHLLWHGERIQLQNHWVVNTVRKGKHTAK